MSKFVGYLAVNLNLKALLFLAGDIESNPGPQTVDCLEFFHWNLDSICARESIEIPLMEVYNSVHHFDVMALSKNMLDKSINNEDIYVQGFSREIYRSDHPSNTKTGGVSVYFREGLPIKRRQDLEILQEMVVAEITIVRKKQCLSQSIAVLVKMMNNSKFSWIRCRRRVIACREKGLIR